MLPMLKVSKVHTGPSIQSNVTHVEGVESAYRALKTEQCYSCQRCQKCIQGSQYRVMLFMSKVSKVLRYIACVKYCTMNKGSNAMYVKGVKSAYRAPQYRVMLLMSKVSKVLRYIACVKYCTMNKGSNAMCVERSSSFVITFFIFHQFSIRKKFWKADTQGFSTISSNTIYVKGVKGSSK